MRTNFWETRPTKEVEQGDQELKKKNKSERTEGTKKNGDWADKGYYYTQKEVDWAGNNDAQDNSINYRSRMWKETGIRSLHIT